MSVIAYFPSKLYETSAIIDGIVDADPDCFEVRMKGLCYSLDPDPTVDDMVVEAGGGPGEFTLELENLYAGELYHVRPFVINENENIIYGQEITFEIDSGTVIIMRDSQGNEYRAVEIGDQVWMAESLRVKAYNDNSSMPPGAYSNYENDATYERDFGLLYYTDVVDIDRLCPEGWHVPNQDDLTVLVEYLGGYDVAGGKMKETGTRFWDPPNVGATNESGFSGRPGGGFTGANGGGFFAMGDRVWFRGSPYFGYSLWTEHARVDTTNAIESDAAYCRCVKD